MVKRFLITTVLEETWRSDEPVLFLGEWCRRYSRKNRWSRMNAAILPYHWDDRAKFQDDYRYLQNFYERLLRDLTAQLNQIHGVAHSLRYWRILVGPWLGYFVQILFDRWTSIQQAIDQYDLSETIVLTGWEKTLVPNDMAEFIRLILEDEWNHHLFATILQQFTPVPCIKQPWQGGKVVSRTALTSTSKQKIKRILLACYGRVAGTLTRDQDAFFLATYLPVRDEIRLYRRLRQLPQFWRSVTPIHSSLDMSQRQWTVAGDNHSEFEACAIS